ncbi:response regulator [Candidatus Seribacter sulfatis]|jgi:CheY-like chemotaxis protein|uniref:response regulator n=1 Tax=Candidatus Seribacter sulfatis TaxID=3381756 RepID=UPI00389A070D
MNEKPKILFVDDEPAILSDLQRQCRHTYDTYIAVSGEEGIQTFEKEAPFSVVVSDQRMPGMDGASFLSEIIKLDPDCTTMLLTGHADYTDAMKAVNSGHVFRLLEKPCSTETLRDALAAGVRQRELIESERVLLHETLIGSVEALTETLSTIKPLFFGRAQRVKRLAGEIARVLNCKNTWQIETAAIFSQLAAITLPEEEAEDVFHNKQLRPDIKKLVEKFPKVIDHLLGHIPRLEEVRAILDCLLVSPLPYKNEGKENIISSYEILRTALEFDYLETEGHELDIILGTLDASQPSFSREILLALRGLLQKSKSRYIIAEVSINELAVGMRLAENIHLESDMLVAPKGTDITNHFLEVIHNYNSCYTRSPFPKMIKVFKRE